jgi:hypothetical protein
MMDWERERQRLKETNQLADAEADGDHFTMLSGTTTIPSEESQVRRDSITDVGLPIGVQRNWDSGFVSLKHSVKASIG